MNSAAATAFLLVPHSRAFTPGSVEGSGAFHFGSGLPARRTPGRVSSQGSSASTLRSRICASSRASIWTTARRAHLSDSLISSAPGATQANHRHAGCIGD